MSIENVGTDYLVSEMETLAVGIMDPVYKLALNEFIRRFKIAKAAIEQIADPKPLTIEELRQMDGEPVWIKADHYGTFADIVHILGKEDGDSFVGFKICYRLQENGYGKTWEAYRHKPKEVK